MVIRCPQCDRTGTVPDHYCLTAKMVRCRLCRKKFLAVPVGADDDARGDSPLIERSPTAEFGGRLGRSLTGDLLSDVTEDDPLPAGATTRIMN